VSDLPGRRSMRPSPQVLVGPDKFRGSLTAPEAARAIAAGVRDAHPDATVRELPIADGGEGTVEALLGAGFHAVTVEAVSPLGLPWPATYARRGEEAVVEVAQAGGLAIHGRSREGVLDGSTEGTGLQVRHALAAGARRVVIAAGGSATTDGGVGLVRALGFRFLDRAGNDIPPGGAGLRWLARIDTSGAAPGVRDCRFVVAADVESPLLGPTGPAQMFAAQKGADDEDVGPLEASLARLAEVLAETCGRDVASIPGVGAAGGIGASAVALLDADIRPGAELVFDLLDVDVALRSTDLVVTGEGSVDRQTMQGKGPAALALRARDHEVAVVMVAGRAVISSSELSSIGVERLCTIAEIEPDPERQIADAAALLRLAARRAVAGLLTRSTR
jgi:glycerate 2-kinase